MFFKVGMDILVDSLYETLSLFPYLYLTYLLMEYLEHRLSRRNMIYIRRAGEYGPVIGALLGLIPQCGFSVAAANLYATRLITLGTLLAIFLSTSDEMLPLLISNGTNVTLIIQILLLKVIYALIAGIVVDHFLPQSFIKRHQDPCIASFCQREKCQCAHKKENIWKSAFKHTEKISLFIFFCALVLNIVFFFGGDETLRLALVQMPISSKFIAAAIGLIPSCYPSVLLTQLYLDGAITLATMLAGTLSNAGLGYLVLYRVNQNQDDNLKILMLLYGFGVFFGLITEILF